MLWQESLAAGYGTLRSESGAFTGQEVTWASRTEQPAGKTSPEELCAAAHSACFSMALALHARQARNHLVEQAGALCPVSRRFSGAQITVEAILAAP